jgi:hypothetical protein
MLSIDHYRIGIDRAHWRSLFMKQGNDRRNCQKVHPADGPWRVKPASRTA